MCGRSISDTFCFFLIKDKAVAWQQVSLSWSICLSLSRMWSWSCLPTADHSDDWIDLSRSLTQECKRRLGFLNMSKLRHKASISFSLTCMLEQNTDWLTFVLFFLWLWMGGGGVRLGKIQKSVQMFWVIIQSLCFSNSQDCAIHQSLSVSLAKAVHLRAKWSLIGTALTENDYSMCLRPLLVSLKILCSTRLESQVHFYQTSIKAACQKWDLNLHLHSQSRNPGALGLLPTTVWGKQVQQEKIYTLLSLWLWTFQMPCIPRLINHVLVSKMAKKSYSIYFALRYFSAISWQIMPLQA